MKRIHADCKKAVKRREKLDANGVHINAIYFNPRVRNTTLRREGNVRCSYVSLPQGQKQAMKLRIRAVTNFHRNGRRKDEAKERSDKEGEHIEKHFIIERG